jgi:hypothetical protein
MSSCVHYSAPGAAFKRVFCRLRLLVVALVMLAGSCLAEDDLLEIQSGPGQLADLSWAAIDLSYRLGDESGRWEGRLSGLRTTDGRSLGDVALVCTRARTMPLPACETGQLQWQLAEQGLALSADFNWQVLDGHWQLQLSAAGWRLSGEIAIDDPRSAALELVLDGFELDSLPSAMLDTLGLSMMVGRLEGRITLEAGRLEARLLIEQGGLDSPDGRLAADGLGLQLGIRFRCPHRAIEPDPPDPCPGVA